MQSQTEILKESVAAAKDSAKAANDNIELVIQKEQARLRIKIDALSMNPSGMSAPVGWTVFHYGTTEAFITQTGAKMSVTGSKEPPDAVWGVWLPTMFGVPEVIISKSPPLQIRGILLHSFSQPERELVEQCKAFVHLWGFIRYKDVFDRGHEVRFRQIWDVGTFAGRPFSHWKGCGTESDNGEVGCQNPN
jgi:hypothetical protein